VDLSTRSDRRLYRACFSMCRRTHPRSGRSRSIPPSPSASPSARAAPAIQDEKCDDDHNEHRHANHQPYFFGDVHLSRIRIAQRPICLRHDRRRPSRARRQEWAYRSASGWRAHGGASCSGRHSRVCSCTGLARQGRCHRLRTSELGLTCSPDWTLTSRGACVLSQ